MGAVTEVRPRRAGTPPATWEAAFAANRRDLTGYARRRLGDSSLAEDAVQETFLRAWRFRARFDPGDGGVRGWLFVICRNVCVDLGRRQTRQRRLHAVPTCDFVRPVDDDVVDQVVTSRRAAVALAAIPETRRAAVEAIHMYQRPYAEVAASLGVPVGTVKSRVHHGLQLARQAIA